ncbi:MAG: nuclear transport factor 2 family protein [Gammaproteobacteria bacterium]
MPARAAALIIVGTLVLGCQTAQRPTPAVLPAVQRLAGHLSPQEGRELAAIRAIHEGEGSTISKFRESGLLDDNAEWFVAGPPELLPFSGSWRGLAGVAEFQRRLGETMRYDRVELREYLVSGNQVAVIFWGEGVAHATNRPFRSEIVRLYTFDGDKIVRVRNYFDSASYVSALHGQ